MKRPPQCFRCVREVIRNRDVELFVISFTLEKVKMGRLAKIIWQEQRLHPVPGISRRWAEAETAAGMVCIKAV